MPQTYETEYHHSDESGNELTLLIKFTYIPPDPGRFSGGPENCYPPEPAELEIQSASVDFENTPPFQVDILELLSESTIESIEQSCYDSINQGDYE